MALHSTYKTTLEVYERDGKYQACLMVAPIPVDGKIDWTKPQKALHGVICETPVEAISTFVQSLKLST